MRHRVLALLLASLVLGQGSSSAQSPSPDRLFELGMNALSGVGSGRDEQGALGYVRHSADLGYPPAEVLLGYFYDTGTIITRDPGQAASWYKKAAQQDDPVGGWLLGRLILSSAVPRDLNEAGRWLQKSAGARRSLWRISSRPGQVGAGGLSGGRELVPQGRHARPAPGGAATRLAPQAGARRDLDKSEAYFGCS